MYAWIYQEVNISLHIYVYIYLESERQTCIYDNAMCMNERKMYRLVNTFAFGSVFLYFF